MTTLHNDSCNGNYGERCNCWGNKRKAKNKQIKSLCKELLEAVKDYHLHSPGERTAICESCVLIKKAEEILK